jgi:two-component system KDP operon response regulator KdpE
MTRIRRMLEPDPTHPVHFITEPGRGYRFDLPAQGAVSGGPGAGRRG